MRTLLNIIWLIFGGIWLAIGYAIAGIVCFLLIITIPLGVAAFRMASFALWPFGRAVVDKPTAGAGATLLNIFWLIFFGWWLALLNVTTAIAQAITIIGIPLAVANLKMIPVTLLPYGKMIVSTRAIQPGMQTVYSAPVYPGYQTR